MMYGEEDDLDRLICPEEKPDDPMDRFWADYRKAMAEEARKEQEMHDRMLEESRMFKLSEAQVKGENK